MNRNELTERLLALDQCIHFVSLHDAIAIAGGRDWIRDVGSLEAALQAPMLACLSGQSDPLLLASSLREALIAARPVLGDNNHFAGQISDIFLAKNLSWILKDD